MDDKLDLILGELRQLNERVGNVEVDISTMKADIVALKDDTAMIPAIAQAVEEIDDRTAKMLEQMVMKADLAYYDQMIAKHDRDIYKLKNA
ncbi:hypothetical protein [Numidum massiliense]|uniref:hypothetical protein n=1 Tax=Numidum massiliense TaxID=1522315 RepID=UPI0006D5918A|nr:hypothetical protein [Numidum massiliense]